MTRWFLLVVACAGAAFTCCRETRAQGQRVITVKNAPGAVFKFDRFSGDIEGVLDRFHTCKVLEESKQFLRIEVPGWNGPIWSGWVPRSFTDFDRQLSEAAVARWQEALSAERQAYALALVGDFCAAAARLRTAAQLVIEVFGKSHSEAVRFQLELAIRQIDAGEFDAAGKVIAEAIATMHSVNPRDEEGLARAHLYLASSEERRGKSAAALALYQKAFVDHASRASRYKRIGKRWLNHGDAKSEGDQTASEIYRLLGVEKPPPEVPNATNWSGTEYRDFLWPHASPGDLAVIEVEGVAPWEGNKAGTSLRRRDLHRILSVKLPWLLLGPKTPGARSLGWVHREAVSLLPGGRQGEPMPDDAPPPPTEELAVVDAATAEMTFDGGDKAEVSKGFSRALLAVTEDGRVRIRVPIAGQLRYASLRMADCRRERARKQAAEPAEEDVFKRNGHGQPAMVQVSETAVRHFDAVVARIGFGQEVAVVTFRGDEVVVECQDEDGRVVAGSVAKRNLAPYRFVPQSAAFLAREITVNREIVPSGLVRQIHGVDAGSLIVDTLRQPKVKLVNPPLLPLSLARVHFARVGRDMRDNAAFREARGILFGESPPIWMDALGLNQPELPQDIAIEELKDSVKISPRRANAWLFLGVRLADKRDFMAAEDAFARAININKRNTLIYLRRGLSRRMAGDIAGARNDFQEALSLDPENQAAAFELFKLNPFLPK
ncbi:MAG: hypothetical protein ACKO38_11745 [Planctomycetota bacterium]